MFDYQFSISLNGKFLFRTDKQDFYNVKLYVEFVTRFPEKEGFKVTVNKYSKVYQSSDSWI